jgi:predicted transcriptional regulator
MKTRPNKTQKRPLTITLTTTMTADFDELAEKIGWSRTTVIERCLAASIKAIKQFVADCDEGQ